MERFFGLYPQVPDALGATHGQFMLRIEIPGTSLGHRLLVTFGTAPADEEGTQAFVLDLYDTSDLVQFETIAEQIATAHANIERAFESIITDSARSLFREA
jgi:hypothetical protein